MAIKIAGTEVINDDKRVLNNESLPDIRPSLLLDFANSKTLDPRITFTRGSTATYWDGKTTAKAEENLVQYSEQFDNAYWDGAGRTITADNTTAPDGTNTADLISGNGGSIPQLISKSVLSQSTSYALSIYAKAGTFDYVVLAARANVSAVILAVFNLSTGTVSSTNNNGSGTLNATDIIDVGNGWYRCILEVTMQASNNTDQRFAFSPSDGTYSTAGYYAGSTSGSIYAWGAQVEQRSSATAYTATTSTPIVKYQPVLQTAASGEARFDHDPVTGESKGLLIEEARTNREIASTGTVSYVGQGTQRTNAAVAPDGTLTALECIPNTTNTTHVFDQYGDPVLGDMTFSLFAKANGYSKVRLEYKIGSSSQYSRFDLSTGTVTANSNATGRIEEVGNGWYRISISFNCTVTGADIERFQILDDNYNTSFAGDGFSGMFIWGYQFEQGAFPTSYTPTSGSTVTRSGDQAKVEDDFSWFNPMESTIYAEYQSPPTGQTSDVRVLQIQDAANTSQYAVYFDCDADGVGGLARNYILIDSASQMQTTGVRVDAASQNVKSVLAVKENDCAFGANGATVQNDTSARVTTNDFAYMSIGSMTYGANGQYLGGPIKKIAYYPQRLSNATLTAMTEE